jgi:hypothetical protein
VRNPLRSEADAFRFVLLALGYFAAIGLASVLGGTWWGLGVFVVLSLVAIGAVVHARRERPLRIGPTTRRPEDVHRILVIANETVGGRALRDLLLEKSVGQPTEVLVVCPALNAPLKHWVSDEDGARAAAQERLERSLTRLGDLAIIAHGEVGDSDPLQAIDDALRTFGPDEIVISTHPEGRSNWLEKGVVTGARERFDVPITHVVVDLEAEREEVRPERGQTPLR